LQLVKINGGSRQCVKNNHWKSIQDGGGHHFEFRFGGIIWGRSKFSTKFGTVMEDQQSKAILGSIIRFSKIQHGRHLESHYVPITQFWIEIFHRIWYMVLCSNNGMFKLDTGNKLIIAAAILVGIFWLSCDITSGLF